MKTITLNIFKNLAIIAITICTCSLRTFAQTAADTVTNNNNENVDITVQEAGSQQQGQGQTATSGTAEVNTTVTNEDSSDNFWTSGYKGSLSVPPGSASLVCGNQVISFSRSGGTGIGIGAAGINLSDNSGLPPKEFEPSLAAIQQCAKEENASHILQNYIELLNTDQAIANTYLRAVSPELYATFFVENSKTKPGILSPESFTDLSTNLRNQDFEKIVEWQDNIHAVGLAEDQVKLQQNRELRSTEVQKQLAELEVLELQRKAKELEAIHKQRQLQLQQLLELHQFQN
jgi:hypothetical protein